VNGLRLSRILWIGAAAIIIAAALVALTAVLRGEFSETDSRILGTPGAVLFAGAPVVAGLALVDRGGRVLGWAAVAVSGPGFAALVFAVWDLTFDGEDNAWQWGWTGALAILAALIAVTAQLLARSPVVARLAWLAGGLALSAAAASVAAIWGDSPGSTAGKVIAVLWILTGVAYLLVPVLQRFTSAGVPETSERVLAELNGVELVATHAHEGALDVTLEPGEHLLLRRRPA
jgi:hypothetical protein